MEESSLEKYYNVCGAGVWYLALRFCAWLSLGCRISPVFIWNKGFVVIVELFKIRKTLSDCYSLTLVGHSSQPQHRHSFPHFSFPQRSSSYGTTNLRATRWNCLALTCSLPPIFWRHPHTNNCTPILPGIPLLRSSIQQWLSLDTSAI